MVRLQLWHPFEHRGRDVAVVVATVMAVATHWPTPVPAPTDWLCGAELAPSDQWESASGWRDCDCGIRLNIEGVAVIIARTLPRGHRHGRAVGATGRLDDRGGPGESGGHGGRPWAGGGRRHRRDDQA